MASPTLIDHLLILYFMVFYPAYAALTWPRNIRLVRERGEAGRVYAYRWTIGSWFVHAIVVLGLWAWLGRGWENLGLNSSSPTQLALGALITAALLAFIAFSTRSMSTLSADEFKQDVGDLGFFLPKSERDERWFYGMSVNAGITEELIYRGFFVWYFSHYIGLLGAAIVCVVAFTFAHAYQGRAQLPGLALVSAFMVAIYLVSGSIWLPILAHAAVDIMQGRTIARVMRREGPVTA